MNDFRKKTPARSVDVPKYNQYSKYREILQSDFHQRCGYCGDHDFFRETYYEIDHFVPKEFLHTISESEYSNLVYSCRLCNNSKRKKWPTKDEKIHNDGVKGFIDPCSTEYPKQFERIPDGSIYAKTELGSWMWSALNLGNPAHRLKYKLEELKIILDELANIDTVSIEELQAFRKLTQYYLNLEEQLREKPDFN